MSVWKPAVTVAAVIESQGRFLFVEEVQDGRRVLNQPAGHLDPGESLIAACKREASATAAVQTGCDVSLKETVPLCQRNTACHS